MTTRKLEIEGMSCGHCVKWITDSLMGVPGVVDAQVSLEARNAIVEIDETVANDHMLAEAVRKAGYNVVGMS